MPVIFGLFSAAEAEVDPFVKTNNWVVYVTLWGLKIRLNGQRNIPKIFR
jgi:hypothetical protein